MQLKITNVKEYHFDNTNNQIAAEYYNRYGNLEWFDETEEPTYSREDMQNSFVVGFSAAIFNHTKTL